MGTFNSSRNYGFGKQTAYAGHNALKSSYQGSNGTVYSHSMRWGQFAAWAKTEGIQDVREITNETLSDYGEFLKEQVDTQELSVSYTQNLLSSVNVTLGVMRGDNDVRISPSATVGQRNAVKEVAPNLDRSAVDKAQAQAVAKGHDRAAAVLGIARDFGLRKEEAMLLKIDTALRQAEKTGFINIQEGTKGGRTVDRFVPVTPNGKASLLTAKDAAKGKENLIPEGKSMKQFRAYVEHHAAPALKEHTGDHIHNLRAAYACQRYEEITGHPAPVVTDGIRTADKAIDQEARQVISRELGHERTAVMVSYIGSAK